MTRGPDQERLLNYVTPAKRDDLHTAHDQWRKGSELLTRLAIELRNKASQIRLSNERVFQGQTATTAAQAFDDTAVTMDKKSKDMSDGSVAFADASDAIHTAQQTSDHLEKHGPGAFPKDPGIPPGSSQPEDVQAQSNYDTAVTNYWQSYHANEQAARDAITKLQDNHTKQAEVFQRIHGETPPASSGGGGGGNPVNQGTRPATTHVPSTNLGHDHTTITITDTTHGPGNVTHVHVPTPPGDPGVPAHHTPGSTPGIPQGPGTTHGPTLPAATGVPGGVGAVGGGMGAMGGVGAVAGGALGGAAAAGLAAGGLNGLTGLNGLMPAGGGVRGSLSAAGVRGIGATSRTGVGSVLGRGTGATGRAGTGGMAGRNGSRGGSRGAGSRGSRGRAGGRSGAGAGAGRNGKDKKRTGEERDLFDDGADWIDDEDIAPGLLD